MGKVILNHLNISLYSFKNPGNNFIINFNRNVLDKRSARKEKSIKNGVTFHQFFP